MTNNASGGVTYGGVVGVYSKRKRNKMTNDAFIIPPPPPPPGKKSKRCQGISHIRTMRLNSFVLKDKTRQNAARGVGECGLISTSLNRHYRGHLAGMGSGLPNPPPPPTASRHIKLIWHYIQPSDKLHCRAQHEGHIMTADCGLQVCCVQSTQVVATIVKRPFPTQEAMFPVQVLYIVHPRLFTDRNGPERPTGVIWLYSEHGSGNTSMPSIFLISGSVRAVALRDRAWRFLIPTSVHRPAWSEWIHRTILCTVCVWDEW